MDGLVLSPTDFVALVNQTLEFAYPAVTIEGELCNFRVAKNRWLYFSLKDEVSTVDFFGTVYQLPGPLEDGLSVRVIGSPRLHQKFGFSVNVSSIAPVGEGSIKKAADLLRAKLQAEGLFAPERKRPLPRYPAKIGLITAASSAAYADFIKIIDERWGGVEVWFSDVYVQGEQAPLQIMQAIEHMNQLAEVPDVLVVTRGGGSAEDLAAFNDERVVRAVAASRIPAIVAVGHEIDESLAELAADMRASTPSNAAQLVVPDKAEEIARLKLVGAGLTADLLELYQDNLAGITASRDFTGSKISAVLDIENQRLQTSRRLVRLFDPRAALARGYAIIRRNGRLVKTVAAVKLRDSLDIELADGKIKAEATEIING